MLKLSRKLDYAILAVSQLGADLEGPISARCLAERTRVPAAILANVLKELCRAGVVRSIRGVHGGYELAVQPKDLSVGELVRRLDGPSKLVECVVLPGVDDDQEQRCDLSTGCPIKMPLRKLHDRIHQVLDELTFDQLAMEVRGVMVSTLPTVDVGAENPSPEC